MNRSALFDLCRFTNLTDSSPASALGHALLLLAHNIVDSQSTSTTVALLPQDQSSTTVSPSSHDTTMNDDFVNRDANITFESPRRYQLAVAIGLM